MGSSGRRGRPWPLWTARGSCGAFCPPAESFFSGALGSLLAGSQEAARGTLYFNLNNPLVKRLLEMPEGPLLENSLRVLYVQALLAGGQPLRSGEMKVMNESLLGLLEEAAPA